MKHRLIQMAVESCAMEFSVERGSRATTGVVSRSPAVAVAVSRRRVAALAATCCFLSWKALDNAIACQHTSVNREVAAYHESTHSSILLGQDVGFVCEICLIFTAIDKDQASVAVVVPVTLVHGVCPSSTTAEALKVLHIEAAHCDADAGGVHLMGKGGRSGSRCGCD